MEVIISVALINNCLMKLKEIQTRLRWTEDFRFCLQASRAGQDPDLLPKKLEDYLGVCYVTNEIRTAAYMRLLLAWMWLRENLESMEREGLAVACGGETTVCDELAWALHDIYGTPSARVNLDAPYVTTGAVTRLARRHRAAGEKALESSKPAVLSPKEAGGSLGLPAALRRMWARFRLPLVVLLAGRDAR